MNLRKVAILLIISLSFATMLPAFSADFQQVEIKGPKGGSEEFSGTVYGPIDSSDTLWQIANRYRQNKNLTIYQVMLAIYQLNPTAFEENNINLLRDGSTLRLPSERYIARINNTEALAKTEQDEVLWQSKLPADSKALINNLKPVEKLASKTDLDQTKQALEQRLGAIDEEQNRQFMAIRQQFAESIDSVQAILNENQKLFERLDSVNTDLNDLRSSEAQRDEQMGQMGKSIDELLKKSRQEDLNKKAAAADVADSDWLRNPITLIIMSLVISLSLLAGFGYWLVGRKKALKSQEELSGFASEPPPMPHSTELDDLSDALSNELTEELDGELDDVDLFGEDDALDDVLSQELEESLDDSIESELEDFDDFGDEMLVPDENAGDFDLDSDTEIIEQEDLDSLFDEDIESIDLSDPDDEGDSIDLSDSDIDDDSIDLSDSDMDDDSIDLSNSDMDDDSIDLSDSDMDDDSIEAEIFENDDIQNSIEEFAEEVLSEEPIAEPENIHLSTINEDQETPEISIDELLEEQQTSLPEGVDVDDPDQINEEMLQNLGKEISSQNEELDSITGTLLDELEQVEQMRSMLPEDDEFDESQHNNDSDGVHQHDIQKLDELTDVFEDELLTDEPDDFLGDITEPKPALDLESDHEVDSDAEPEVVEPESESEIESEPQNEASPEAELASEPETESESESESENEAAPENELALEPETESEPNNESVSEAELASEPETESELENDAAPEAELASEPETESELELENDAAPEAELAPEPDSELNAGLEDVEAELDRAADTESELSKALDDFEDHLDVPPSENLSDNEDKENQPVDSIFDDLESSIMPENSTDSSESEKDKTAPPSTIKPLPDLDDIGSLSDFDDGELEKALMELDSDDEEHLQQPDIKADVENQELADMPGLGDWLSDTDSKKDSDNVLLEELESSSFDELLESIDIEQDEELDEAHDDSDLDIEALLSAESVEEAQALQETIESDDFLDVEALLTESIDAESNPLAEKNLDLDLAFGEFAGVTDDSDSVDVDDDKGIGAKLDLAQAYIEIGEIDSAKELLIDIIAKGNPEQVEEAQSALSKLG